MIGLKDWRFSIDPQGIAWAIFDREGESQNSLSRRALEELGAIVERVEQGARDKTIRGLVIMSGKEKGFIVGADVREFEQIQTEQQVAESVTLVNAYLNRIERMPVPVVCCIHGYCLGGGLELALACHWRIATRDDDTRIGFPEVKLGIFPGFNGTARSIRQAGALAAMPLMLTGSFIRATAARGMGLVDELAPSPLNLRWMARKAIERKRRSGDAPLWKDLARQWPARGLLAKKLRTETAKKVREEHYPAPFRLIDLFENHAGNLEGMKVAETRAFAPLMLSDTSKQPAPRVPLSEMMKAQAPKNMHLEAAARARDRRRHDGRRHRRRVRRRRHGGVAAGHQRRADRQGHRRAGQAVRPQVQDQGAARGRQGAADRRSDGQQHRPGGRGDRGDRREARGQAEPVQVDRGEAEARRGDGHQHLLDHDREDRRAAGRSEAA